MNAPTSLTELGSDLGTLRFGSGQTMRRIEDPTLLRGEGRFTDDLVMPGQAFAAFVRSPHAHARVLGIDATEALALPGVWAVHTGAELVAAGVKPLGFPPSFKRPDGSTATAPPRRALAHEVVRYVGEAVALVVASSPDLARRAADRVAVDWEPLPVVADIEAALADGAPLVWPDSPGNVLAEARHGDAAATAAAFAAAAHVVELVLENQRLAPTALEPRSVNAWMDGERLVLRMSSQMPAGVRGSIAGCVPGRTAENVRVTVGDVGGGFGMKTGAYPEDIALAWAALQGGRPVKWQAERVEEFTSAVHGRGQTSRAALALDANGRVLGLRIHTHSNAGGCPGPSAAAIPMIIGPWVSTSIYDIRPVDIRVTAVMTHNAPPGAYRGAGRPEAIYIIERLMDAAARRLGLDAAEVRRRNMVRPEQMPYVNAMAQRYDCGAFEKIMDQGLALADWAGFEARRAESATRGLLRGRGIATFLEWTGGNALAESVRVDITADGDVELTSATMPMGQGIATSYVQLAVDVFGLPPERIRVVQGDTDRATGFGSAGSRSLFTGGAAVRVASEKTLDEARRLAAEALEAAAVDLEYAAGRFAVAGTDLGITLAAIAAKQTGSRLVVSGDATAGGPSWPNGCHVAEVEIDPDTGTVELVAYHSVNDIGRVVSPQIVQGQVEGGAVQGIGQALSEAVVYDRDSGQLLSASLMDYALPRVDGFRGFVTHFDESVPCQTNLLGAKGVGELGTIGATPAVVNAVVDALARQGHGEAAEQLQMPLTSEKVWRALRR